MTSKIQQAIEALKELVDFASDHVYSEYDEAMIQRGIEACYVLRSIKPADSLEMYDALYNAHCMDCAIKGFRAAERRILG